MRRALLATGALAALLFGLLAALYDRGAVARLDARLERARRGFPEWLGDLGHALEWLGGHWWLPPIVTGAVVLAALRGRRADALLLVAASAGADAFLHLLKVFIDRDRPGEGASLPGGASFPSGHATTALTIYVALALVVVGPRGRCARLLAVATAAALGLAVGAGRFLDGQRTAADVVGGSLLGVALLALIVAARFALERPAWR